MASFEVRWILKPLQELVPIESNGCHPALGYTSNTQLNICEFLANTIQLNFIDLNISNLSSL